MANRPRTTDYSGQAFGRPKGHLIKGLKVKYLWSGSTAGLLTGQDSIFASEMSAGLDVYCGYINGLYNNYSAVVASHPGKLYVGIGAWVAPTDCLDVEPGDAVPGDCPAFFRQATHPNVNKPVIYTSAGDAQACINAMSAAGIPRSAWYLWSAHYGIGAHVCGPATCGFPAADGTQWQATTRFDSDLFSAYMFGAPSPYPTLQLTSPYTTGAAVGTCQARLNAWQPTVGMYAVLPVDQTFGPDTALAVRDFQGNRFGPAFVDGVVGPQTWKALLAAPPAPPKPPAPVYAAPTGLKVEAAGAHSVKLTWIASPRPAATAPEAVYALFIYDVTSGAGPSVSNLVQSYPRTGITQTAGQWGSLEPSRKYAAHVTASAPNGSGNKPGAYASVEFSTPA